MTYAYTVTNTGDVPLINVKTRVTDDKCTPVTYASGDTNSNNILETTETWRFNCTTNITIDTTNTATTIGTPSTAAGVALPGVPDVNDTDQAIVDIVAPGIRVVKTAGWRGRRRHLLPEHARRLGDLRLHRHQHRRCAADQRQDPRHR